MSSFLDIDPRRAIPIWKQIETGVRRLVAAGRLPAETALPSVRELAAELRVNPATVAKAYRRLVDDGVLEVRRGEGTFVSQRSARDLRSDRTRQLEVATAQFVGAVRDLGVDREEMLRVLERTWQTEANDEW